MQNEKRLFQRVPINLCGHLTSPQGSPAGNTAVDVLDVSLQGVRIVIPASATTILTAESVTLAFQANEDSPMISLTGTISHQLPSSENQQHIEAGISITHIDVEGLALLRRLLLLNSGQQDMDAGELEALVDKITNALQ
ncbi:PilZ domain-containing protein [Alteromonas lipolytica]|uniref:PilZ domain-containing protein n=1 Tax=Alteromonas lipolytica TaxID=1856405 RepID=A0A1E8F9Q0_9ALTE|nr:PilZ domain-containing protein [Alteromonas lipolytica]OFI32506.1 hypothetical protein BFC17_04890 [Alteromonas lipolytica]GGF75646.1 hypothetical protein GCM10011338_29640 [Alteromonas lipolytica]